MDEDKRTLSKYVEGKIFKGYMAVSRLSEEEFSIIDVFCKENFHDNRRRMILELIKEYNNNTAVRLLDDKLYLIYDDLSTRIEALEAQLKGNDTPTESKRPVWEGFKK